MVKLFCISILAGVLALAHGENVPGPNGGHIQMPANFHTEVVPSTDGSFHVYLLDMEFKNPTTENSTINVSVVSKKKKVKLKCMVMNANHFHCVSTKPITTGTLTIKAKRNGTQASIDAKYELPLKPFVKPKVDAAPAPAVDHSKHH